MMSNENDVESLRKLNLKRPLSIVYETRMYACSCTLEPGRDAIVRSALALVGNLTVANACFFF